MKSSDNTYYIMMIDGSCYRILASSKVEAFSKLAERLDYDDFNDFLNDVNLVEYKTDYRVVEQYTIDGVETHHFTLDSEYELSDFLKLKL